MATPPPRTPIAGGFFLILSLMAGVLIGATQGQTTAGFFIGLGIGLMLVVAIWVIDRRRG
jgi:hypothetical protein